MAYGREMSYFTLTVKVLDLKEDFMRMKRAKLNSHSSVKYTLWTSPRASWESPVQSISLPENAEDELKTLQPTKDDKQIAPFRTPVTPDVLEITVN
jgi:hypothetical protein